MDNRTRRVWTTPEAATNDRPAPRNLSAEPTYPGLEDQLVCFSIRFPDWTIHMANQECPLDSPHRIEDCPMWR